MPRHVSDYLALFSFTQEKTKSAVIRSILVDHVQQIQEQERFSEKVLIQKAARGLQAEWYSMKEFIREENLLDRWEEFLVKKHYYLRRRLGVDVAAKIIKQIHQ